MEVPISQYLLKFHVQDCSISISQVGFDEGLFWLDLKFVFRQTGLKKYIIINILFIMILHYNILYYQISFTLQNLHLLECLQKLFGAMGTIIIVWQWW